MRALILFLFIINIYSYANEKKQDKKLSNSLVKEDLSSEEKKKEKLQKEIEKLMSMIAKE